MRKIILGLCALTTVACSSQNTFQVILDYPPAYSNVKKNYKEGELVRIIYAEGGGFMYDARVSLILRVLTQRRILMKRSKVTVSSFLCPLMM